MKNNKNRSTHLTVGELQKALRGLPKDMPVYTVDHDHSEWETNGRASKAEVRNQEDMSEYAQESLEKDDTFKIKGDYFIIGV